ncbi:MAG TPA: S8 family serine peptidase [Thermoleophilaceae bacterium]|nr:S8 family serine peptidase [Thermoleophilaceae bacterium]
MRRATLVSLACAVFVTAVPAQASGGIVDRAALKDAARLEARAAAAGPIALPLTNGPEASAAAAGDELAAIARSDGPVRVLVGARAHSATAALAAELERLGARAEVFRLSGVLAATVPSGAALSRALGGDPRVAYIERDRRLSASVDPFDSIDTTPGGSGIKYTWAYDEVRAAAALAAAGGGSSRTVAVVDTGVDVDHPELAGRIARTYDLFSGGARVTDLVGHGTFVAGLIAAVDGNGIGGKGVAGATKLIAVRASEDGSFRVRALVRGIEAAIARRADVINLSLAGRGFSLSQLRALQAAFYNDVLPVAASGNSGLQGNPIEFPAAALGGKRGRPGIGLSVTATRPGGGSTNFSTHNDYVSIAAPGAGATGCELGVFSILPTAGASEWDTPSSCSRLFSQSGTRFAYGEGTSFAAPVVAGIAALAWHVQPRLASEQVADVLTRSARQTVGRGWNDRTGAGVVDGGAATALARIYDVTAPPRRGRARRRDGSRVAVSIARARDRTRAGRELAGRVTYAVLVSRDGGETYGVALRRRKPLHHVVRLKGRRVNALASAVCDANGNCALKRLGRFRLR